MYIWQGSDEKKKFILCWSFTWIPNISLNCSNFSGLKLRCFEDVFQYWKTGPAQYDLVKEEITSLFASWLKQREVARVDSRLFNVALPRKSAKSCFCQNGIITACKLLMSFNKTCHVLPVQAGKKKLVMLREAGSKWEQSWFPIARYPVRMLKEERRQETWCFKSEQLIKHLWVPWLLGVECSVGMKSIFYKDFSTCKAHSDNLSVG